MTKISKARKLEALIKYFEGNHALRNVAQQYGIPQKSFRMMVAAYHTHGPAILLDPPTVTPEFRVEVAKWAIEHDASYTQVAAEFGYLGGRQIQLWKEIYRQNGPNGLLSITKGRKPIMTKKEHIKKQAKRSKKQLSPEQNRIEQLEAENLELRIKLEASKLLASMKQRTDKSQK